MHFSFSHPSFVPYSTPLPASSFPPSLSCSPSHFSHLSSALPCTLCPPVCISLPSLQSLSFSSPSILFLSLSLLTSPLFCLSPPYPIRMIPASNKAFVVNNLVSGTGYDLCVLAMWDDTATTLTATNIVGCAQFFTKADYPQCQSMHSQILGGTMILVIGGIIVATLLVFIVILMVRYKVCNHEAPGKMAVAAVSNVHSQTNGAQPPVPTLGGALSGPPAPGPPKVVVRNELVEFSAGLVRASDSSSSSSLGSGEAAGLGRGPWRLPPPAPRPKPNLDRLMGAFASLDLKSQRKDEPLDSRTPGGRGSGASARGHHSDREPLLGPPEARVRNLLPLSLEGKAKRSHSFDMGDFAAAAAGGSMSGSYSPPRRVSNIWTKRSLSVNGMLLPFEESDLVGARGTFGSSEWVMESTV